MTRTLSTATLDLAAEQWAAQFALPTRMSKTRPGRAAAGRGWVLQSLWDAAYRDEHAYIVDGIKGWLGPKALAAFEAEAKKRFAPREDATFAAELAARLAVDPAGNHIPGRVGSVVVGRRFVGFEWIEVETAASMHYRRDCRKAGVAAPPRLTERRWAPRLWPVYAGEAEERAAGAGPAIVDPLPRAALDQPQMALGTVISNEAALLACDAVVDRLDEGAGAAVISIYEAAKPADVDTAVSAQTLGARVVCSDPAFGDAADATPDATATADTITGAPALATVTAAWFRASATDDGDEPVDDHIDGTVGVGTAGVDFDMALNTTAIVTAADIDVTSWTFTLPEAA